MSFELMVWQAGESATPERAADVYHRLADGESDVVPASAAVLRFADDVVARYEDLTEQNMHDSPWSSPLYRTPEGVIVSVAPSRRREVVDAVRELAHRHGLSVYDPQNRTVDQAPG